MELQAQGCGGNFSLCHALKKAILHYKRASVRILFCLSVNLYFDQQVYLFIRSSQKQRLLINVVVYASVKKTITLG